MKKSKIILLGAMLLAVVSCTKTVAPSEGDGNGNETGGNGENVTPELPESAACYVLSSIVDTYSEKNNTASGTYGLFDNASYISVDWCERPVLESFEYVEGGEDLLRCRLVYALPSYVYLYAGDECIKMSLNKDGYVKDIELDKYDTFVFEYDSNGRLVEQTDIYRDGDAAPSYQTWTYSYDSSSNLVAYTDDECEHKIEYTSIPAKTAPLQYWSNNLHDVMFWFEMPLLEAGLLGTAVPQCLVKRIAGVDEDGDSEEIVYSYKVNANGYVKEMKAIWSSETSSEPAMETCVFEWEKYVPEED